jgi:hypothetical protein
MIRNLKALIGAVLVLTAFGAIGSPGAQGAEFHCLTIPCRVRLNPDGTGKLSHHVFIVTDLKTGESVSFTCPRLTGEGTLETGTASELTITNLNYNDKVGETGCTINGSTGLTVNMNGCDYKFQAAGLVSVECPFSKEIEIVSGLGCTYKVPPQSSLLGISYTTIGTSPNREVTASTTLLKGIKVTVVGSKAQCLIEPSSSGHPFEGRYTTGNTLATAETNPGESMTDGWWL